MAPKVAPVASPDKGKVVKSQASTSAMASEVLKDLAATRLRVKHVAKPAVKETVKLVETVMKAKADESNEKVSKASPTKKCVMKVATADPAKETVAPAKATFGPVTEALKKSSTVMGKLRAADCVKQDKVPKLRTHEAELKTKVGPAVSKMPWTLTKSKPKRDIIKSKEAGDAAKDMLLTVSASWKDCQEAEMPFLMGVEVLEIKEKTAALDACKTAALATDVAIAAARKHIQEKLRESRTYVKELAASTKADLDSVEKELQGIDQKLAKYKKELNERKVLPMLSEALHAVASFEEHVKSAAGSTQDARASLHFFEAAAKGLWASNLEDETIENLSEALEEAEKASQEANKGEGEAKNQSHQGRRKPIVVDQDISAATPSKLETEFAPTQSLGVFTPTGPAVECMLRRVGLSIADWD